MSTSTMAEEKSQPRPGPKDRLLERVIDYLTERGVSDLSLRELGTAIGSSHRMLTYHFGSKEELMLEVVRLTERRQQQALSELFDAANDSEMSFADLARVFWRRLRSPELAPLERLFFELYGQGLQGRAHAKPFLSQVVQSWIDMSVPALRAAGLTPAQARAQARLGLAVVRGLLLDLLATGDQVAVDKAFEQHLAGLVALHAAIGRSSTGRGNRSSATTARRTSAAAQRSSDG